MNKYLLTFKLGLATYFEYRLNLFLQLFSTLIFYIGLIILWLAIYQGKTQIGGFSQEDRVILRIIKEL